MVLNLIHRGRAFQGGTQADCRVSSGPRLARVDDVVLIDQAADETAPRCINCYLVEVDEIDATSQLAEDGKKFKVDPSRLLYALRWLNWDEPPDLDLTLVRDPALWFKDVTTLLLSALNRHNPHLFDAVPLPAG